MITPKTIGQFLLGNREAIEKIAHSKSLILALVFIISAGLARNYDHHILTEKILWIGGPIMMSLFSSLFIFAFIKLVGRLKSGFETGVNFGAFFQCFIMTAPMAWLYGIPVEQFTEALPATIFNFIVLLIVSFWRVALMVRVIHVLFGYRPMQAFILIAIPASVEMFFATMVKAVDIVGIMGGMRLTQADEFLLSATQTMTIGSIILFVFCVLTGPFWARGDHKAWEPKPPKREVSRQSWIFAILVCAFWLIMAIKPQKRLENLETLRTLILSRKYQEASKFAKKTTQSGFPPHRKFVPSNSPWNLSPAAIHLAHSNEWPDWLRDEFKEDVHDWIKRNKYGEPNNDQAYSELHSELRTAPFYDQFAKEFMPDFDISKFDREEDMSDDPQD